MDSKTSSGKNKGGKSRAATSRQKIKSKLDSATSSGIMEAKKGQNLTKTTTEETLEQQKPPKCGGAEPAIEDCTTDIPVRYEILPNSVQLVKSDLPLCEAENFDRLSGVFLFRQILSSNEAIRCLLCRNRYIFSYPSDLENHYRDSHELAVSKSIAEFDEDIISVCVPQGLTEDSAVDINCFLCETSLKTLSEIRDHYPYAHTKAVNVLPISDVSKIAEFFYCGLCGHPSDNFKSHHEHMKETHVMQTYVCCYCTYCTSQQSCLMTHVKEKHPQERPEQCSLCSVYVEDKDELTKHMLSHAVQTEKRSPDDLAQQLEKITL